MITYLAQWTTPAGTSGKRFHSKREAAQWLAELAASAGHADYTCSVRTEYPDVTFRTCAGCGRPLGDAGALHDC